MIAHLMLMTTVPTTDLSERIMPIGNPAEWIKSEDFPNAAIAAGIAGMTGFELSIGSDGSVERCRVTQSSGSPLLDGSTCGLVTARARFLPGKDAAGRQAGGSYRSRVRWLLPKPDPYATANIFLPRLIVVRFEVSETGKVENCQTLNAEGIDPKFADPCRKWSGTTLQIAHDAQGKAIRKTVIFRNEVEIRDW